MATTTAIRPETETDAASRLHVGGATMVYLATAISVVGALIALPGLLREQDGR